MERRTLFLFAAYFFSVLVFIITFQKVEAQVLEMVKRINTQQAAAYGALAAELSPHK